MWGGVHKEGVQTEGVVMMKGKGELIKRCQKG